MNLFSSSVLYSLLLNLVLKIFFCSLLLPNLLVLIKLAVIKKVHTLHFYSPISIIFFACQWKQFLVQLGGNSGVNSPPMRNLFITPTCFVRFSLNFVLVIQISLETLWSQNDRLLHMCCNLLKSFWPEIKRCLFISKVAVDMILSWNLHQWFFLTTEVKCWLSFCLCWHQLSIIEIADEILNIVPR